MLNKQKTKLVSAYVHKHFFRIPPTLAYYLATNVLLYTLKCINTKETTLSYRFSRHRSPWGSQGLNIVKFSIKHSVAGLGVSKDFTTNENNVFPFMQTQSRYRTLPNSSKQTRTSDFRKVKYTRDQNDS